MPKPHTVPPATGPVLLLSPAASALSPIPLPSSSWVSVGSRGKALSSSASVLSPNGRLVPDPDQGRIGGVTGIGNKNAPAAKPRRWGNYCRS